LAEPTTPDTPTPQVAPVQPTPVQEKKKGNGLKIVIIVLIVLFLLCALCGGGTYFFLRNAATNVQTQVKNEINKNGGSTNDSSPESGSTNLLGSAKLPEGFPSSVLLASDYQVITSSSSENLGMKDYSVSYYSSLTIEQLEKLYKTDMVAKGWTLKQSGNLFGFNSVMLSKSGIELSVVINGPIGSKETRNMVTLVYQEK
jgi:hypothetical protein